MTPAVGRIGRVWLLMTLACAPVLRAQITVSLVTGTTETPVAAAHSLGTFAVGDTTSLLLRVRNQSVVPVQITRYNALGSGFTLIAPSVPFIIAGNGLRDVEVRFAPTSVASYSANVRIDTCSPPQTASCPASLVGTFTAVLLATAVAPPELTVFPPCTGQDPNLVLFGAVERGQARVCNFNLRNATTQNMTLATLSVSGDGFSDPRPKQVPFTLAPGQATSFSIQFTHNQVGVKTGFLRVETRVYILSASSVDPPLPKPIIEFDPPFTGSSQIGSAQQRRVSLRLPSPAPFTASGALKMSLSPDSSLIADDTAVAFLNGLRQVDFSVQEGSTSVTIAGQPSAAFQTGTSSGRIRFTLSGIATGFSSDPTTDVQIPRAPLVLDQVTPSRFERSVALQLSGYDNTYSLGAMSFSFYDAAGRLIQTVPANFTSAFQDYFRATTTGSLFQAILQFQVNQTADVVKSVEVELTNSAGTSRSPRISF